MTDTLTKRLRHAFQLPDSITDSEVLAGTTKTTARAFIEFGITVETLQRTINNAIRDIFNKS